MVGGVGRGPSPVPSGYMDSVGPPGFPIRLTCSIRHGCEQDQRDAGRRTGGQRGQRREGLSGIDWARIGGRRVGWGDIP